MPPPALLTMPQAAEVLGYKGARAARRALRFLRGHEQRTGRSVLVSVGGERDGARFAVARRDLDDAMRPADEVRREETAALIREHMRDFEERVTEQVEGLSAKVDDLFERDHVLAEEVRRLREGPRAPTSARGRG